MSVEDGFVRNEVESSSRWLLTWVYQTYLAKSLHGPTPLTTCWYHVVRGVFFGGFMNQLITATGQTITMSTREIAELLGKQHSNIKISAERLASSGVIGTLALQEFTHNGNAYTEYLLNKRDSLILVAQNCPEFTARIVDRWQELEAEIGRQFRVPSTMSEALRLAADQAEIIEKQTAELAAAAPKVGFYDRLVDRKTLMTASQVAQKLKMSAVAMNKILEEMDVYSRGVKRARVFKQWFIDAGLGELKQTELGYSQPLFTPSGEAWVVEKMTSEGVVR